MGRPPLLQIGIIYHKTTLFSRDGGKSMAEILKPGERLIYAGCAALRAPDGTRISAVPQYIIAPAGETGPYCTEELRDNERLVMVGTEHCERKSAEERYAAELAGRPMPPQADGKPLYIKVRESEVDQRTALSEGEKELYSDFAVALLPKFKQYMDGVEAASLA